MDPRDAPGERAELECEHSKRKREADWLKAHNLQ
jgi:hypothetical protein